MTTTATTAAQRRAKRKGETKTEGGRSLTVKVDGEPYTLHTADLGPLDTIAVRRATGMSLRQVLANAETDPDIDILAVIVWRARVHAGETGLTFEQAVEGLSYGTEFTPSSDGDDAGEDDTSPNG